MLREVYDFSGAYVDRSDIHLSFDGIRLEVEIEDQEDREWKIVLLFHTVVKFDWEFDGVLKNYQNEPSERLLEQDADDYLMSRAGNDHPFLDKRLRNFNVLFSDLGKLIVIAREVAVNRVSISHNS